MRAVVFSIWLILFALVIVIAGGHYFSTHAAAVEPAPAIVKYSDGSWFVPEHSGLGPAYGQIKAFVQFNGTVCLTVLKENSAPHAVASMDEIAGLRCVPKARE